MKTLVEYIKEAAEEKSVPSSKTFTFNFKGLEGAEDTLKSAQEIAEECGVEVEVEEEKIKVTVKKESVADADKLFELLQDFIHARRNDEAARREESYAEKTRKLEELLGDWRDYVDDADEDDSSEEQKEDKDKEDKKDKKEEE